MSSDDESILTLEEVERALTEIENKFSPVISRRNEIEEILAVLSKEYDSVGLPTLDLSQSSTNILHQVVSGARSLIQIHRKTLSHVKDINIDNRCKNSKTNELYKTIDDYKAQISKCKEKTSVLQKKIEVNTDEYTMLMKREVIHKNEMEKIKRYHTSQQNALVLQIKKLTRENQRLKEIGGRDIGIHHSKDDVTLKLLGKYKRNEEIYKNTIQKLQENNKELLKEILNLREELVMNDVKKPDFN